MNKISNALKPFLNTSDYRGINLYQHSGLVDDPNLIFDFFQTVINYDNFFPCKETDLPYINFSNKYGWKTYVLRKNLFSDLEKMGLIQRHGKNWDFLSLTSSGKNFLNCDTDYKKNLELEKAHRFRKDNNKEFSDFIDRMRLLIKELGILYWWEIWMSMRLDVEIDVVKKSIIEIRQTCRESRNQKIFIDEVTKLINEHNIEGKKQNGRIDFRNILTKVCSFGIKAVFFHFSVSGNGRETIFKSFFNTGSHKPKRTNKRNEFYLMESDKNDYEYHHAVPFIHVKYNQSLQPLIDDDANLIPLYSVDHEKFPKKNNKFLHLKVDEGKIRFYSYDNIEEYIEIEKNSHLNFEKLRKIGMEHNRKLLEKLLGK